MTVTDDPGRIGQIRAKLADGSVTRQAYGPPVRVDEATWHHVAVVFDRDTGIVVHVDGVTASTPGPMAGDVSNAAELLLGKARGYPYFRGGLDEAAVYPAALPHARVLAHYDAGRLGGGEEAPPVDTAPPETAITTGPADATRSASASFSFASEVGAGFECRLDEGGWGPCSSPAAYSGLLDGSHTFRVRAIDGAGNVDASPATWAWSVDTGGAWGERGGGS